jgi:hypothetical protein
MATEHAIHTKPVALNHSPTRPKASGWISDSPEDMPHMADATAHPASPAPYAPRRIVFSLASGCGTSVNPFGAHVAEGRS